MYINIGNDGFRAARNGEYVDKSMLIREVNAALLSERQFICVSRARRFGKSMAAKMLNAYYDQSCDSRELFQDLQIAKDPSFETHLNKYPVLYVDMAEFIMRYKRQNVVEALKRDIQEDLKSAYPDVPCSENTDILLFLDKITSTPVHGKFFMIIDEWDAILREFPSGSELAEQYIEWLRLLFKSTRAMSVFAGVYMTGILPIKKYNMQSALNNFSEFTMVEPKYMASYFGFTEGEVKGLCKRYKMDWKELKTWYDGYTMKGISIYNPLSVIRAVNYGELANYWSKTGTYETVASYINMNYEGLKDDILMMLAKGSCVVNPDHFRNDLHDIRSKNDVLSVLVHLGYLTYDQSSGACRIPNREVSLEFEMAIRDSAEWGDVAAALQQSEQLLRWTLAGEEKRVADAIDKIHADSTSILKYNDENSLACVLTIAYYAAMNTYRRVRELPSGNGFADIVLVPKKHVKSPAIVLELKYDHTAESAINQIKRQRYADALVDYVGEVVLVGVNYDKDTKVHSCVIERVKKGDATSGSVYSLRAKVSIALEKSVYSSQESVYSRKELCPAISTRLWGKAMLLIRLLALHEELSVVELMEKGVGTNRARVITKLIDPLRDAGVVVGRYKDNQTHPDQRYRLTEKGLRKIEELLNKK